MFSHSSLSTFPVKAGKEQNILSLNFKRFLLSVILRNIFQVIKEYLALNDFSMKKSILRKGTLVSYQFAYLGERINQGKSELIQ